MGGLYAEPDDSASSYTSKVLSVDDDIDDDVLYTAARSSDWAQHWSYGIDCGSAKTITKLTVSCYTGSTSHTGWMGTQNFSVLYSTNNSSWTLKQTFSYTTTQGVTATGTNIFQFEFPLSSAANAQYWKVVSTTSGGPYVSSMWPVRIGEIDLEELAGEFAAPPPFISEVSMSAGFNADITIPTDPFVAESSVSMDPLYGHRFSIPPFIETLEFINPSVLHVQRVSAPTFTSEVSFSMSARERLKACWSLVNSINTGRHFLISVNLELQKTCIMYSSITEAIHGSWSVENVISSGTINPAWAIKNDLIATDTVTADWAMKNTIGTDDLDGTFGFWSKGAVIHSHGSHGGYE